MKEPAGAFVDKASADDGKASTWAAVESRVRPTAESRAKSRALVLGGGVTGLTTALRLLQDGWNVDVAAREVGGANGVVMASASALRQTTSNGAGAMWEYPPFHCEPRVKCSEWLLQGRSVFEAMALDAKRTGVHLRPCAVVARGDAEALAARTKHRAWSFVVREFQSGAVGDSNQPRCVDAVDDAVYRSWYRSTAPVVFMPRFLRWLHDAVVSAGATIHRGYDVSTVDAAIERCCGRCDLVVNCLGLGAAHGAAYSDGADGGRHELEHELYPARGALVYVMCPELTPCAYYEDIDRPDGALTYVVPQGATGVVACAGTFGAASDREIGAPRTAECAAILERCREMLPALREAPVVGQWAGLRPMRRSGVRLELVEARQTSSTEEAIPSIMAPIIHNYGHGGSGVVLSWGCAHDVAELARSVARSRGLALTRSAYRGPPLIDAVLTSKMVEQLGCTKRALARL
tara:strand:+ start:189 stop:1577 length:1389 start_codon:yes stop_codon:yes gene_type:complete